MRLLRVSIQNINVLTRVSDPKWKDRYNPEYFVLIAKKDWFEVIFSLNRTVNKIYSSL